MGALFPSTVYAERRERAFSAIRAAGLETYIALHPTTLHWLTGCDAKSYQAFQCALLDSRDNSLILLTRDGEHAEITDTAFFDRLVGWSAVLGDDPMLGLEAILKERDLAGACGVEIVAWYLTAEHSCVLRQILGSRFIEAPDVLNELRLVRSPEELNCLRRAGRIADTAIAAFSEALRPGIRECDLAAEIYSTILREGGDAPPVPLNLSGGPRAAYPHGAPTDRILEAREAGNVEFAVPWKRYTVSMGRTYSIGPVPLPLVIMYDTVVAAQEAMLKTLRAGISVTDVYEAGMTVFRAAGMERLIAHTIGYSVAPAFPPTTGERLGLSAHSQRKLQAGITLSISPNLFSRNERLGARLVDNVVVNEGGFERLGGGNSAMIVST